MKKIIIFTLLLIISNANASFLGIVDRTATRDTLAIPFCLLDSIGSPTTLASGDSVYVNVFAPGGVEVFDDSMAYNDASIKSSDWEDYAGVQYMYMEQVSVLDGASTADGVFTVHVTVQDLTSAALTTTIMHTFQIVNSTLESSLDSAGLAAVAAAKALDSLADILDSLETQSTWIQDSLYAILDTLQNQDNWVATAAELAKVIDSLADILDSLETQSTWMQDSLYALLDTLQLWDTRIDSIEAALADANIGDKVWTDGSPATRGEINDILDTLQNQDDWVAKEATVQIIDDTLDLYDTRFDSLLAAGEDAKLEKVWYDIDTTNIDTSEIGEWFSTGISASLSDANMGAIADSVWDKIYADMVAQAGGAGDSLWAILNDLLDTLQLYDTRLDSLLAAASDAKLEKVWHDIDTTNIDTSEIGEWFSTGISASLSDANMGAIADSVWDKIYADMVAQAGGAGDSLWAILNDLLDSLKNHDDWVAKAAELTKAIDSINALLDTLQLYDGRYALAAELTKAIDSVNAILDTLQLYDGRYALAAELVKAIDSINAVLDTLQLQDDWVATEVTVGKALDSLADVLDTLENHDNWIATATNLTKAIDSINALLDTLQLWDTRVDSIEAALADAKLEKVWYNIDTTNIDTSEIGEWFSTGVSASLSNANMAAIGDTVWQKLINAYTGTAGCIGDVIYDSLDAKVSAAGGSGSGDNAVKYYAVDTSGTDEAIMDVKITMNTIEGVYDASGLTNASGYKEFTAPTDEMVFLGRKCGYFFTRDTNDISGSLTDTLFGYDIPLQASPDPNLCRVQGYVSLPGGLPDRKIKVTFTVSGEAVHNSCDSTAFIAEPVTAWTSIHADSLGFFYADLTPSGCLLDGDDSLQYKVTQELRSVEGKEKLIWVPQAESYEVVW